jgi:flavodoxin
MKRISILVAFAVALLLTACAQKQKENQSVETKTLVAYFSATGTTAEAAQKVAAVTGGVLHEIQPAEPYTDADLDWRDKQSRSSIEMADKSSRPAVKNTVENIEKYDTIYVGFPIWWGIAPTIVNTFLEQYKLEGKTLVPFFTSGGSEAGETMKYLTPSAPKANWKEPINLTGKSKEEIEKLVK